MAKKQDRRSLDDIIAERRGVPGRDPQVPTDTSSIYMNGEHIDDVDMNFRGLMGGLPTGNARALRRRAEFYRDTGATDSANAAEVRARSLEGSNRMTRESEREIALRKLQAAAEKPGASQYAKDRYRMARETGMVQHKKGGSVQKMAKGGSAASKRADGCCTKGKTKGKFV